MRNPWIAGIGIVFDDNETSAGLDIATQTTEQPLLVAEKMKRVCHENTYERRQVERLGKISVNEMNVGLGEMDEKVPLLLIEARFILFDGKDFNSRTQDIAQCEGESAVTGTQVSPRSVFRWYSGTDEVDVIRMLHKTLPRLLWRTQEFSERPVCPSDHLSQRGARGVVSAHAVHAATGWRGGRTDV